MKRSSTRLPLLALIGAIIGAIGIGLDIYSLSKRDVPAPIEQPLASTQTPIVIPARNMWTDTGITLSEGQSVEITATGSVNIAADGDGASKWVGPDGWGNTPTWYSPTGARHQYFYETDSLGALRGKVGNGEPFKIGSYHKFVSPSSGVLYLGVEDTADKSLYMDNRGTFNCVIKSSRVTKSTNVQVLATDNWKNSGLVVTAGDELSISASGSVVWDQTLPAVGPDGTYPASTIEQPSDFPLPTAGCGSLIMKIGTRIYAVGSNNTVKASEAGSVLLMINDRYGYLHNNSGNFTVKVRVN